MQATSAPRQSPQSRPDYEALVQINRIHSSLYYDEQVYREEVARIWHTT